LLDTTDAEKIASLYQVGGLHAFVKKLYPQGNEKENALLMEFVLHGLASYSLISKKMLDGRIEFKDLMGSMMNFGTSVEEDDDLREDDFR
jgi:magnesium chelatase subunit I